MTSIRDFERMLFRCPEVNVGEYPQASYEEFLLMEQDFSSEFVCVFPFVRQENGGKPFVEIYIWDVMLYPDAYKRFIICDGMCLPESLERLLFDYCKESFLCIGDQSMEMFNAALLDCFPHWHCVPYPAESVGRCIEHIYYASHRSGPREILYKAGLVNIAYNLEEIPKVNLIGSTASKIIGHDLTLKLLRILNQPELIGVLYEEDSTEHAGEVYKTYASFIGKDIPSANQWRYLDKLYSDHGLFAGMGFNRSLYRHLAHTSNKHILDSYKRYFELFEELKIEKRMRIPKADNLWEATEKLERLHDYEERLDLDEQIRRRKYFSGTIYEFSDDSYIVAMPDSCADICKESIAQENCLMDYICDHASGVTTILFLRKKDKPDESYVTMEVNNWQIKQVYGCCNTLPEKDVYQFLIEKYSKDKCFLIDLQAMVDCYIDNEDEMDDDLMDYLYGFLSRNNVIWVKCDEDDREYIQLTLADYFPDLFDE